MNTKLIFVVLLFAMMGLSSARPGYLHGHFDYPIIQAAPIPITKYIHLPSGISHQSSTIIHSTPIIKPIVVPVVKTIVPVYKTYHPAPIIKTIHYDPYHHYDFSHYHH